MAACRSLLTLHPENETYKVSLLKYKSECIEILRAALSNPDHCISDHTIALALVLSTEEVSLPTRAVPVLFVENCSSHNGNFHQFLSGNVIEYRLHGDAILRMVQLRGGFKDLGPGGLLGYLLARSVYNPVFQFVDGPDATALVAQ